MILAFELLNFVAQSGGLLIILSVDRGLQLIFKLFKFCHFFTLLLRFRGFSNRPLHFCFGKNSGFFKNFTVYIDRSTKTDGQSNSITGTRVLLAPSTVALKYNFSKERSFAEIINKHMIYLCPKRFNNILQQVVRHRPRWLNMFQFKCNSLCFKSTYNNRQS